MKLPLLLILLISSHVVDSQIVYDPQISYEAPGGLMDQSILREMDITFYDPQYDSILDTNWYANTGLRLPATILLDGIYYPDVAIRYKGNSTFAIPSGQNNPKLPFNIDMNDLVPGQNLMGYKKVKLANAMFDPTFVKEITAYNIYRRYLPSPEANFMKVNVQGNYLGLYVNTEAVDPQFLMKHFNDHNGPLFKCDPIQQYGQPGPTGSSNLAWLGPDTTAYYDHYALKSQEGWEELVNLINVLNNSPADLDTVLNIDRVLWAFAVNQVILNLDTYNGLYQHNYYLYQTGDGLFQMIPWDVSESYLAALLGANFNSTELYEYDPYNGYNNWWYPLCYYLTSNPDSHYGKIYTAHLRTIMNESLDATAVLNEANTLQALAYDAADTDPNKYFTMANYSGNVTSEMVIPFVFSAAGITSTIDLRKPYLESITSIAQVPPTIGTPVILPPVGSGSNYVTAQVSGGNSVELMATISPYSSKFISIPMYDDGTNGDQVSGDGNYTGLFPWHFGGYQAKFYIRANNAVATMLNPERAEYEFYIYDLPLDIDEENSNLHVNIYPNPANDAIHVDNPEGVLLSYSILNSLGKTVSEGDLNSTTIDIDSYSSGVYFINFHDLNGNRLVKKLIINK
ncbi:MAG: CotH kinase family protein [Crocinitomicaceae bacterium]|nr:CotH kinase family protein [Crocinitomicaceae bacterium]